MLKTFIVISTLFFASLSTAAEQTLHQGILQVYWLPVWSDDGQRNTPELKYRYFVTKDGDNVEKVINLNVDKKDAEPEQLKRYFPHLPSEFLTWKEGHIERAGAITVDKLTGSTECDHRYFTGELKHFTPANKNAVDTDKLEKNAGCEAFPWMMTYTLKSGVENKHFKQQPDDGAKDLQPVTSGTPLVKIKTINANWIQVAVRDENKPGLLGEARGYIKLNDLQPIN
ncbi:hypothetical protein K3G69_05525 [Phytobacter diazotrophicus]|uniref:hypothetical protein n=1 Tax=Phytobacter diazotrophicus TaxID=395631 RepID=UPI001C9A123A|nr:hypothetical protein [Phytobacter diazotrophicus]MBY6255963.1 hypothetical protein [Phytobacter diazotrophicus]